MKFNSVTSRDSIVAVRKYFICMKMSKIKINPFSPQHNCKLHLILQMLDIEFQEESRENRKTDYITKYNRILKILKGGIFSCY